MRVVSVGPTYDEVFSLEEVARAARVPAGRLRLWLDEHALSAERGLLTRADAVRAVRHLRGGTEAGPAARAPLTLLPKRRRRAGTSLVLSGLLHGAMLAMLLTLASLGLLNSVDTEQMVVNPTPVRLVFLRTLGPGGGGGGGGLKMPAPPPPAERKAPPKLEKTPSSPVPPVKKVAAPPVETPRPTPTPIVTPPVEIPRVEPPPTATPEPPRFMPPQAIQAPVVPQPADKVDTPGTLGPPAPGDVQQRSGDRRRCRERFGARGWRGPGRRDWPRFGRRSGRRTVPAGQRRRAARAPS